MLDPELVELIVVEDLFNWFVEPDEDDCVAWLFGLGSIAIDISYNTDSSEIILRRWR